MVVAVRVVGICIGKYDLRVDGRRFVLCTQSWKTILSLPLVPQPLSAPSTVFVKEFNSGGEGNMVKIQF